MAVGDIEFINRQNQRCYRSGCSCQLYSNYCGDTGKNPLAYQYTQVRPTPQPALDAQQVPEGVRRAHTKDLVRELEARGATIAWAPAPKGE